MKTITVRELIEHLQKMPSYAQVRVHTEGQFGGPCEASDIYLAEESSTGTTVVIVDIDEAFQYGGDYQKSWRD